MHSSAAIERFSWRRSRNRPAALLAGAALLAAVLPGALSATAASTAPGASVDPVIAHVRGTVGVIVQAGHQSVRAAEEATRRLGGSVTRDLPIVNGFAAKVPGHAIGA